MTEINLYHAKYYWIKFHNSDRLYVGEYSDNIKGFYLTGIQSTYDIDQVIVIARIYDPA